MLTPVKALLSPFLCCNFAVMKRLFSIIIGVYLLVGLTACQHHHPYNNQLARIDSLADVNPDSADILLRVIPDSALMKGEEYFERVKLLLRIKVDDKLYRPVTHYRDTILQLVDYFEHHIDYHLPTAYYYAGRIFYDLGDMPQALDFYQKGSNACKDKKHRFLSNKLNAQMAYIFYNQDLFDEAIVYFQKGLNGCQEIADTMGMIYDLRDIACSYKYLHQYDSSLVYFDHALELALQSPQYNMQNNVMIQKASLYKEMGNYDASLGLIVPILAEPDSLNLTAIYSITAEDYLRTGYLDSASVYLENLLEYGNDYGRCDAHRWLAEIAMSKHDVTKGYYHLSELQRVSDTLRASQSAEIVARMHAAYNYQKHKQKAADLELANTKKQNTINIISILSIIVAITAFFFFRSLVHRQKIADQRLMELNAKLEEQSTIGNDEELKVKVAKYEKEIAALSHQLQETDNDRLSIRTELESLISKMSDEKIALEHAFRRASNRQKNQEEAVFSFSETSIYIFFAQSAKEKKVVPAEKWVEFIASAETNYFREFKNNLTNLCRISEHEYRMCLLFKSGFSKADIAKLLLIDRSAVGHAFARMYARSTKHKGTVSDWEKILLVL